MELTKTLLVRAEDRSVANTAQLWDERMSIVSGITTAPGVAPLLNAPRETQQSAPVGRTEQTTRATLSTTGHMAALDERPVIGVSTDADAGQTQDIRASSDERYSRFVKAVQALRTDPVDKILDDRRVAELISAAEDFFLVDDGIPQEVQPLPPDASILVEPWAPPAEPDFPESVIQERLAEAEKAKADADAARTEEAKTVETAASEETQNTNEGAPEETARTSDDREEPREERARQRDDVEAAAQNARSADETQRDQRIADAEAKKRQSTSPVEE